MGDYNGTCYISKLPIMNREDIVLIFLYENYETKPFTCYTFDRYKPVGVPVYGKYNGYGSICSITNASDVVDSLNELELYKNNERINFTVEKLENEISDYLIDIEPVILKNNHSESKIEILMIKRSLYNELIAHVSNRPANENKCYKDFLTNKIFPELDNIAKQIKNIDPEKDKFKLLILNEQYKHILYSNFNGIEFKEDATSYVKRKYLENKNKKFKDYLLEILLFQKCLSLLRMGYYTISGNGSQSEEMLIHCIVAKYVLKCAQEKVNKAREEDEYDNDEEILAEPFFLI